MYVQTVEKLLNINNYPPPTQIPLQIRDGIFFYKFRTEAESHCLSL